MKAAHGSPPLTRPNRHHSNSSYDRMKVCPALNSQAPMPNKRTIMPPFLRLDSAGEVTSLDRVGSVGHQRTNTCSQGASHCVNFRPTGGNGILNKLSTHLLPQATPTLNLLNSSRFQNGFCALDNLLNRKQTLDGIIMAGKSSHMKMVHSNWPHLSRYGQWGSMCPDYTFLPQGVFPCHVFQARQLRDPSNTWGSTSGQFVMNNCTPGMSLDSSLLHTWWKCSADKMNAPPLQKNNTVSSISKDNVPRRSERASAVQNHTYDSKVNKVLCGTPRTRGPSRDTVTGTTPQVDVPQLSRMENVKETYIETCLNPSKCIGSSPVLNSNVEDENKCNMTRSVQSKAGICVPVQKVSTEVTAEKHEKATQVDDSDEDEFQTVDIAIQAADLKEGEMFFHPQCEGAECMEVLKERQFYSPQIDCDCPNSHSDTLCLWGRVQVQSSNGNESAFDSEDEEVDQNPENTQSHTNDCEEIWKRFIGAQFCLSDLLSPSVSSKKQRSDEERSPDEMEEKKHAPKPCPAVTERWRQFYSSVPSEAESPCKVRFECGEGKDTVHKYQKGEEEAFTVMEIQKTRDLNRQHGKNAATLLQKRCEGGEPDADHTGGDGSDVGCDTGPKGEKQKTAESCQYVFAVNVGLVLVEEDSDAEDSDCEDSGSEEEDSDDSEDENDAGDGSDDDFIVFENE